MLKKYEYWRLCKCIIDFFFMNNNNNNLKIIIVNNILFKINSK